MDNTDKKDWISLIMYLVMVLIIMLPFKDNLNIYQYISIGIFISFLYGLLNAMLQSIRSLNKDVDIDDIEVNKCNEND